MTRSNGDDEVVGTRPVPILTPDQRVRVFVSSTMQELADERAAVREAVSGMHLSPVLFELGARAHPPRSLYRSYLEQSHVFVGIYWERYGWVAPTMEISGLEDEYLLAGPKPKLMYVKRPAAGREPRLEELLDRIRSDDKVAYKAFADAEELGALVTDDLSILLSEAFLVMPSEHPLELQRFTLPSEATAFVGRAREQSELQALLERDTVRLVTLTGPGGIGKTRLALRVAADVAPAFTEGAAFVPLASVADEHSVVGAIATAVGLRDTSGMSLEMLAADLGDRSLLLVIDNFEHVIGAASTITVLLRAAPHLKVIVTSREALRLHAEQEFPVPSLALADSVAMFLERANAVRPDFRVDDAARRVVERICRQLEGVPLAIELAAARTKLLTPAALLGRLDHRLDFLAGGPRDLPERQRALRSTIEWSYDLLDESDRRWFACLGVFAGSFSLAAAEAIATAVGVAAVEVLDLLASLVDKSLLRVEPTDGEPRFRMLGMIAEFARARLEESDDSELVGEAHAVAMRDIATEVGLGVVGGDQAHWLAVLGDDEVGEAGNVRAALAWFMAHGRLDEFASMAWALWVPAWINGRIDEGRRLAEAALSAGGEMTTESRNRLLVVLGMFEMWGGNHDAALDALREGGASAAARGDIEVVAPALLGESMIVAPTEGEARAEALSRESLQLYRQLNDTWGEAAVLNMLSWLYVAQARFDGNAELFRRTVEASVAAGDAQFSALAEVNLAEYRLHDGDVDGATELLVTSARRHRSQRLLYSLPYLLDAVARLASHEGDLDRAARLVAAAAQMRRSAGVSVWGSQKDRRDGFVAHLRAELGDAAFAAATGAGEHLCYSDALADTMLLT